MGNKRKDGLNFESAVVLAARICSRRDISLERTGKLTLKSTGLLTAQAAEQLHACLVDLHGFGVSVTGEDDARSVMIDVSTCPDDATPEERERLAETEAAAWEQDEAERLTNAGESDSFVISLSSTRRSQQYSWCMQQTIVFLRKRAQAAEAGTDSAVTPAT